MKKKWPKGFIATRDDADGEERYCGEISIDENFASVRDDGGHVVMVPTHEIRRIEFDEVKP